ncbi:MAG: rRNA maturation RNase YbeY [Rhodocyclales bacterium]|nr:rRNA maturation RNase YbeY [Rhodocyclales bacterium]
MPRPQPELALSIQYPGGKDNAPTRHQVRRWVTAACSGAAEITVRFVDADEGQQLNHDYRNKDYATNVLSFPYQDEGPLMGDLVVCLPVVAREAAQQGKSLTAHFAHLIVHGMLHLQGFDHETGPVDAAKMEARERKILEALGYPDPYL